MLRKLTAIALLGMMTLIITLKHPVLGYCDCVHSFFAGNCGCHPATPQTLSEETHCCSHCAEESATAETQTPNHDLNTQPCHDCSSLLMVDVDDFVGVEAEETSPPKTFHPLPSAAHTPLGGYHTPSASNRGPPPPETHSSYPIYLRQRVLRL